MSDREFFDRISRGLERGQEVSSEEFSRAALWAIRRGVTSPGGMIMGILKWSLEDVRDSLLSELPENSSLEIRDFSLSAREGKNKFSFLVLSTVYDIRAAINFEVADFTLKDEEQEAKTIRAILTQTLTRMLHNDNGVNGRIGDLVSLVNFMGLEACSFHAASIVRVISRHSVTGSSRIPFFAALQEAAGKESERQAEYRRMLAEQRAQAVGVQVIREG